MLRGNWLPYVAAVGLVLSANAYASPVDWNANRQHNAPQSIAHGSKKPEPAVPPVLQDDIKRIARALETANAHPNAAAEEQRAKDNLKAQQNISKWAWIHCCPTGSEVKTAWFARW